MLNFRQSSPVPQFLAPRGIGELGNPSIHLTGDFCKVARERAAPVDVPEAALYIIYTAHHVDLMERQVGTCHRLGWFSGGVWVMPELVLAKISSEDPSAPFAFTSPAATDVRSSNAKILCLPLTPLP